jgi:hypothetical protein
MDLDSAGGAAGLDRGSSEGRRAGPLLAQMTSSRLRVAHQRAARFTMAASREAPSVKYDATLDARPVRDAPIDCAAPRRGFGAGPYAWAGAAQEGRRWRAGRRSGAAL